MFPSTHNGSLLPTRKRIGNHLRHIDDNRTCSNFHWRHEPWPQTSTKRRTWKSDALPYNRTSDWNTRILLTRDTTLKPLFRTFNKTKWNRNSHRNIAPSKLTAAFIGSRNPGLTISINCLITSNYLLVKKHAKCSDTIENYLNAYRKSADGQEFHQCNISF